MIELSDIMEKYRMNEQKDGYDGGYQVNRLYGLQDLITQNLSKKSLVCEVGCFQGHSSMLFAYYCKKLYCIDLFLEYFNGLQYEKIFDENMSHFDNVIKIKSDSVTASKMFKKEFDLVYIDAGHLYEDVHSDIIAWKPKVKKGGFLAGHDYMYDVQRAVLELLGEPDKVYKDSSWLKKL